MNNSSKIAFIIGSPRSGTTILGNILNTHPDIGEWYEPYYIWLRYFNNRLDDIWIAHKRMSDIRFFIRREFDIYRKKKGISLVIDKSPGHALNIESILQIFPESKWVHIVRDGRDVTLSIKKEWNTRKRVVEQKDFIKLLKIAKRMIERQPFIRYKIKALIFEFMTNMSLNPIKYLNKSKWQGNVGWGPRFRGWDQYLQTHSSLEFNAMQWVECVKSVRSKWDKIPNNNKLEIRYEKLIQEPYTILSETLSFLGYHSDKNFFNKIPTLQKSNFNKWRTEFTQTEIDQINPILSPLLEELGYAKKIPGNT